MGLCFAPDCDHTNKSGCKMFRFPNDSELRKKWENLVRRGDRKSNKFSVLCSCHFQNGDKSNLPSIFKRNVAKRFSFPSPQKKKRSVQRKTNVPETVVDPAVPSTSTSEMQESRPISRSSGTSSSSIVEAENYFLKKQVEDLQLQLQKLKVGFDFSFIENNDRLIHTYTGLPDKAIFMALFTYLDSQNFKYYLDWSVTNISRLNQFLITLMKLRLNLLHEDLALRFGCSSATISNIVITWLHVIHECLYNKFLNNHVPSRHKNKTCMPSSFSPFTNCKMIIDCTEIYTEIPLQLDKQKHTYSNYKHRNTLKGLVGVAPNGTITFLSKLYVGNTSDKKIVRHCGVLTSFLAGDLILADKGFLITDILPPGVLLNIPPFLMKSQFSHEEARQTVAIAKARIHVERAIRRIKEYKILRMIPANLRQFSSLIFQVCGSLTTLNYPLIKEVEDSYAVD